MKNKKVLAFLLLLSFPSVSLQAYWVWSPEAGKFINAGGASQDSAEEQFDYAMKLYREKNLDQAADKFKEILKKTPQSRVAPEAQYRLGLIFEEKGDYLKALKTYKSLVESYPQSERFNEVIEREFRIGNLFLSGKKAKLAGLEILPSLPQAVNAFEHVVKYAPYSEYGDKAQFHLGLAYKKWRHYGDAVNAFQELLDRYPQSELIGQTRYELAETSFLRSASNTRDQRALEDASKRVSGFLERYPESSTAEKAAAIRQQIDEKNAEKNYRIGLYYEKDNFIESAQIYYSDVAARYPGTQWGQKAAEKLKTLKEPAKYLNEQKTLLDEQERTLENKLKTLEGRKKGDVDKEITRRSLERLRKHQKTLEKDKKETLQRRKEDLARRGRELKEKFKNLEEKKKLLKKNKSEDLQRAIERWNASLINEQQALEEEKKQLAGWKEELGVSNERFDMSFLPFVGPAPNEVERIRQIEAKKFYKLSEQKKSILEEKETLYKHHSEVSSLLRQFEGTSAPDISNQEIQRLETEIKKKTALYEKHYGHSTMLASLASGVRKSIDRSLEFINPFDHDKTGPSGAQQILERRMHLQERIATQEALVQTLTEAFDAQIALQEHKRLLARLENKEKADPKTLRKSIRQLERQIRGGYEEIESRHKHKQRLVEELDRALKQRETQDPLFYRTARIAAAPATGAYRFFKAFLFGLPVKAEEVTKSASRIQESPDTALIKDLEEQIRVESSLIEAKSHEIVNLRKELEILKAQASMIGGYKFRSVFISIPYLFLGEALESARRVVPKKDREEILINRIHDETQKLEKLKGEMDGLEKQIGELKPENPPAVEKLPEEKPTPKKKKTSRAVPSEAVLKQEIETLHHQLETQQIQSAVKEGRAISSAPSKSQGSKKIRKLEKELGEIEGELEKVIRKEGELETEESSILEKRIQHIDRTMKKVHSKAVSQDLLTEKERMEQRLTQLESRKDFLSQESKRFELAAEPASNARS